MASSTQNITFLRLKISRLESPFHQSEVELRFERNNDLQREELNVSGIITKIKYERQYLSNVMNSTENYSELEKSQERENFQKCHPQESLPGLTDPKACIVRFAEVKGLRNKFKESL